MSGSASLLLSPGGLLSPDVEVGPGEEGVAGGGEETQGAGEPDLCQRTVLHRRWGQDPGESSIINTFHHSTQEGEITVNNQEYGQVEGIYN